MKNFKKLVLFVLLVCFVLNFSACKKADNLEKLSANLSTYSLNVDLDTQNMAAHVDEQLKYVNNSNAVIKMVKFHLYPQFFKEGATDTVVPSTKLSDAYPHGMSYAQFEVLSVKVNGAEVGVNYVGEHKGILQVDLMSSLMPEESVNIDIEFSVGLPNCFHRFGYGDNTINLANFYPIACVYENGAFDEAGYNPNGDPFYSDMANYNVKITADSEYKVAATGEKLGETIASGRTTHSFKANMVRDFALVLSNKFEVVSATANKVNVNYFYFDDAQPKAALQAGVDAINTFSKLFGAYPYSTFNVVKNDFVYGGMEYPNLVMISADIPDADDYKNVIIHETAHQWWYGMVGNNEHELPWLDEGLTEYSTILFYDYNTGYAFTHADMVDANRQNYVLFLSVYNDVLGEIDTSMRPVDEYDTEPEYTYCTYVKGVLMFESVYQAVGQKKFVKALSTYFENCKYKNATKEDLISAFESATGTPLKSVFNSWLNGKVVVK